MLLGSLVVLAACGAAEQAPAPSSGGATGTAPARNIVFVQGVAGDIACASENIGKSQYPIGICPHGQISR